MGQTISRHRITAAIGVGGMGEVYRETGAELGREVALEAHAGRMQVRPLHAGFLE